MPFSVSPNIVADTIYLHRRILIFRLDHVEKMRSREHVCIICLDGLPTGKKPFLVNKNCVLGEKCCASGCVAFLYASSVFLSSPRSSWTNCASTVSSRWAKAGRAKLISSPIRAAIKRIFTCLLPEAKVVCRVTTVIELVPRPITKVGIFPLVLA